MLIQVNHAVPAVARNDTQAGMRTPNARSSEKAPGPARATAPSAARFVIGSSAPPAVTQIGLPLCALATATTMEEDAVTGPSGFNRPSAVSRPPPNSAPPAANAQRRPGRKPIDSSQPLVPSKPDPPNEPNSFWAP